MKIQQLPKENLSAAYRFGNLYGGKRSFSYFKSKYKVNPDLFTACFERKKLIGKKLLTFWEIHAKKTGKKTISLGAATKPMNIVGFYKKSGYKIIKEKTSYILMEKKI